MDRKGFTLIELLIVVVIIGILAAIAIPRFGATRERAFQSAVVSDLRNLQTVQEQWYADPGIETPYTYADLSDLEDGNLFRASSGVTITVALQNDDQGYVAVGSHSAIPGTCEVLVGNTTGDNTVDNGAANGEIACDWDPED
jgi:type IV pilus assembly protein PilA